MDRDNSPYDEGLISSDREGPLNPSLASLTTSSLNHFTENLAKAEALNAEIAIITNDLRPQTSAREVRPR